MTKADPEQRNCAAGLECSPHGTEQVQRLLCSVSTGDTDEVPGRIQGRVQGLAGTGCMANPVNAKAMIDIREDSFRCKERES